MSTMELKATSCDAHAGATAAHDTQQQLAHHQLSSAQEEDADNLYPALFEWTQPGTTVGITGTFSK